jgi:ABC transporter substrate binding protein (PQQ-dependent alcohol dehydrogenase system)
MILRWLIFLLAITLPGIVSANALEITIVTSQSEDKADAGKSFAGITVEPKRSVNRAVELAVFESSTLLETLGLEMLIKQLDLNPDTDVKEQLSTASSNSLFILDLPLDTMEHVAHLSDEMNLVAVNVRHSNVYLRQSLCLPTLFHTIPSDRMYFDALGQFLIYRGWRRVLLIQGPSQRDTDRAQILAQSLTRFGATIVDQRTFTLSHFPDDRDKNKPEFLTGGASYDVVAVIDSDKDYGRYLQYSTRSARPVVGDVGLTPKSWHFALERYGAPQLNERYRTFKRNAPLSDQVSMTDAEFAAWSAVKLITNSINARQQGADLDLLSILHDSASQVDLYKGTRGSIRHWNNQLRQPILLATPDAVIAIAPMPKFLHPEHYVDTLGVDEPESECRLRRD